MPVIAARVTFRIPPAPRAGVLVGEAEHEVAATRGQRCAEASCVGSAFIVGEDVEQPAVEHGVEGLPEGGEFAGVVAEEPGGQAALMGLVQGGADGIAGEVDAGGITTTDSSVLASVSAPTIPLADSPPRAPALAENLIRAVQAACSYALRIPPSRWCRRISRWTIWSGSVIGGGSGSSGRTFAMPWWGR